MSDTLDTLDTPTCNTKDRGRCWGPCTWNNWTEDNFTELKNFCEIECEDYAINQEVSESGTPHLQFCFKFKNARTFISIKNKFPKCHIEKSKNWMKTKKYCSKLATATGPPTLPPGQRIRRPLVDPLEGKELRPFQQELMSIIDSDPDDRRITWVFDEAGCAGKTTFAKHLCIKRPNEILYVTGKSADIRYGVTQFLSNEDNDLYVVLIGLTRSVENFVSYEGIEQVKDGLFYNTKYESKMVTYNCPHVIVFANFEPDYNKLTEDRWNMIVI